MFVSFAKSKITSLTNNKYDNARVLTSICIGIILLISLVYWQVGSHEFLNYDDDNYVTKNTNVAKGITYENVMWAFTTIDQCNWHPITWLTHMADVQFYSMNPRGHHLTNVIIHIAASVLLLLLLNRSTGALWQSSFVAALFALHPLHVESVAWVAERKDVLSAFFGFLSLFMYVLYVDKLCFKWYFLSISFFIIGLMSKPMLVSLPIILLLFDFWPLNRYRHKDQGLEYKPVLQLITFTKEKIPFIICSIISSTITVYSQKIGGAVKDSYEVPFELRIENALVTYVKYIAKTFWPHDLAILYPLPPSVPLWQVVCSLIILLIISGAVVRAWRNHPYLPVGWFWYLITLVPVIGLVQVGRQSMADRYTYIPLIGLFIIAAWGVPALAKDLPYRHAILALTSGAVVIASSLLTWHQLGYWRDNISLYSHTLNVTSGNFTIHNNLGIALSDKGYLDAAIKEYQKAITIKPNYPNAHNNLGVALAKKGNLDAAIKEFKTSLIIKPSYSDALNNLGVAIAQKKEQNNAVNIY